MLPGFANIAVLTGDMQKFTSSIFIVLVNPLLGMQLENKRTLVSYLKSSEETALTYWQKNSVHFLICIYMCHVQVTFLLSQTI